MQTLLQELRSPSSLKAKNATARSLNLKTKPAKQPADSATAGFSFVGFCPSQHQWKLDYLADQRSLHQLQNCLCCLTVRRLNQGSSQCLFSSVQHNLQAEHQLLFANQQVQIPKKQIHELTSIHTAHTFFKHLSCQKTGSPLFGVFCHQDLIYNQATEPY